MWALEMLPLALFVLASCATAASHPRSHFVIHDAARYVPEDWKPVPTVSETRNGRIHRLHFALRQASRSELEAETLKRSDPLHANYGRYLTQDDVNSLLAPSSTTLATFEDWLSSHGIDRSAIAYSSAKDWAHLDVLPELVEAMLDTKLKAYKHAKTGEVIWRTQAYSLPLFLHDHVDAVQPTTYFGQGRSSREPIEQRGAARGSSLHHDIVIDSAQKKTERRSVFTPSKRPKACPSDIANPYEYVVHRDCLRAFLRLGSYKVKSQSKAPKVGVLGFDGYLPTLADFQDHSLHEIGPRAKDYTYDLVSVNHGSVKIDLSTDSNEPFLDVQQVAKLAYPLRQVYYTIGGTGNATDFRPSRTAPTADADEPWFAGMTALFDRKEIPKVLASSYGDEERTYSPALARRICTVFMAFAARGITVLGPSGDAGLACDSVACDAPGGKCEGLVSLFPASCPFVLSVGATEQFAPEAVGGTYLTSKKLSGWSSGAGVSNYFERPAYQSNAVASYKGAHVPEHIKWNPHGRAFPDVAIQGTASAVWAGGDPYAIGGTSSSVPAFGAIVALLNDALEAEGRPAMGFMNPWLYRFGMSGFRDITVGATYGCGSRNLDAKFAATPGFDLASGWGTPDWPSLLAEALKSGPK
ncbi:uncharacterized protein L969DRAFT_87940 [Mixia osmundae IAM 14324]|uniref:Peptidase S53 domain-containing protein n=1 Tax=Mixia osmundae (strain CBS 9802 / IAM 14324 / JCM 22182 / KY 12970) TaxID=764103 RepID=G7E1Z9_MIXOS|nr:uncharacterized protein L969DRAFT_87940 [Mixia osmundae IAM 14324]KEI38705.1 hypothetical protein L969DRAFT_87940 [Mixia osmundae IAM 14324]GAA96836.1 hypothetical protein E5Q_03509 [Mixia osmundae IAM 14324]